MYTAASTYLFLGRSRAVALHSSLRVVGFLKLSDGALEGALVVLSHVVTRHSQSHFTPAKHHALSGA
jgi:hypothetical protein